MEKNIKLDFPKNLKILFDNLVKENLNIVIVGGYLRDRLFGLNEPKDFDIEVYGIKTYDELVKILNRYGKVNLVGKSFGTAKLRYEDYEIDFSLPRTESKVSKGHKGFLVKVDPSLNFKEASRRRDFTINSMGYDYKEQVLLDFWGGLDDIKNKILREVDAKTFTDDPLRVLRGVQFAARFELRYASSLRELSKKMIKDNLLDELPKERVFEEIKKLLLKSKKPSIGFKILKDIDGFLFFKELGSIKNYEDMLKSLDYYKNSINKNELDVMLAITCHFIDKNKAEPFLDRLTNEKRLKEHVLTIVHIDFEIENYSDYDLKKLSLKTDIKKYLDFLLSVSKNKEKAKEVIKKVKKLGIYEKKISPLVTGKDLLGLGLKPSKEFSKILDDMLEKQLKDEIKTKDEAMTYLSLNCLSR